MKKVFSVHVMLLIFSTMIFVSCSKDEGNDLTIQNPSTTVNPPKADFKFTVNQSDVNFENHSTGKNVTYLWDFGDGKTSNEKNPSHSFESPGTFKVTLTVKNSAGDDKATKNVVINENPVKIISRLWVISEAYGNGNPDPGTQGKTIEFFMDGTYTFDGSFNGVWKFTNNNTRVLIDEGESFEQDWKITTLTTQKFEVEFKSPFDGSNLRWVMEPY